MKSLHVLLAVSILFAITGNCIAQENTATERKAKDFSSIHVQGMYKVFIVQSDTESVVVDAPAEIKDRVVTVVRGGVLKIRNKHDNWSTGEESWYSGKSWWHHHPKVIVYVKVKHLQQINTTGSSEVYLTGGVVTDELSIRMLGSGSLEGAITTTALQTRMSGSATLKLMGRANNLDTRISGSGNFDAASLITMNTSVHILGSGHATVNASETVNAALYGSSALDYSGTARINCKKVGSAAISKL